jgi:Icc-related predicted phosphoesterase
MIQNMLQQILERIQKEGLSFLILCGGLVFLYIQNERIQVKADKCFDTQIESLKEERSEMLKAIRENSELTKQVLEHIKK